MSGRANSYPKHNANKTKPRSLRRRGKNHRVQPKSKKFRDTVAAKWTFDDLRLPFQMSAVGVSMNDASRVDSITHTKVGLLFL